MFRAAGSGGEPLADVSIAVINNEVKLAITPRRLVRCLGGRTLDDSVRRLLGVVMAECWTSEALQSQARPQPCSTTGSAAPVCTFRLHK